MSREWESSKVMSEFLKIAAESGLISSDLNHEKGIGNPSEETPVKDHRRYEPTKEYGIKTEPKDMIEKAHPSEARMAENSTPVNSMGDGSLVENLKEQQKKDIEIATKMPHGTLVGVHASIVQQLVRLANSLEDEDKIKEAARIDEAIKRIASLPFEEGHLRKQSGWFLIPFLLAGGFSGVKMFGQKLTSKQENLRIDLRDLYDKLNDYADRSRSSKKASQLIAPFLPKIDKMDLTTKEGSDAYSAILKELGPIMKEVGFLVKATKQDIGDRSGFFSSVWGNIKDLFGFEDFKLLAEKYKDAYASYKDAVSIFSDAKQMEDKVISNMGGREKAVSIQDVLARGFRGKKYESLEGLEMALNTALTELFQSGKLKKELTADLINNGKLTSSPQKILEVLEIVEKKLAN